MKKIIILVFACFVASAMYAQRCAVLEFKAGAGISQSDIEGISSIFNTYFQPAGYTMVERIQIDRVINEQGFQRSNLTQRQMVRLGEILNVTKVVVGDVTIAMGQYNVDVRVVDVETGTESGKEGATFTSGSSYRATMRSLAEKLATKISITQAKTVYPKQTTTSSQPKKRESVEILYGYLKIYPNELGDFQTEPTTIISHINSQSLFGYNNWRIPTNEELSLLRANNYLGSGNYMTKENKSGIVLLVSDGDDYTTLQAKEKERLAAENIRRQQEEARRIEEQRERERQELLRKERIEEQKKACLAQGFVDLGLPSGTLWKEFDQSGKFTYKEASSTYKNNLPTEAQIDELIKKCSFSLTASSKVVCATGPNGNKIFFNVLGFTYRGYNDPNSIYWGRVPIDTGASDTIVFSLEVYSNGTGAEKCWPGEHQPYYIYVHLVHDPIR